MSRHNRLLLLAVVCIAMTGAALAADEKAPSAKFPSGIFISIRDHYIGETIFPTPIEGLRKLGIDAVELNLGRDFGVRDLENNNQVFLKTDDDAKAYRQHVEKLGAHVWALMTACDFSAGDPEANVEFIARAIQIADLLGASAVRIDSAMSKEKELDFDARVKLFADGLGGALKKTADSKVVLGIENHGFQGNNLAFLLNVFLQVKSDRLGSTLDIGNFYWRGYPLSEVYGILRILAPYAKHTHVKNINYPVEQREVMREAGWEYTKYFCPLEEGDIDIAKVVGMLIQVGYKGDLCVEDESVSKCKTADERAAVTERDIAHLQHILEAAGK
jgi:sugar phosphate isomerase/epimerase